MENVSWNNIRGRMKDILVMQEKAAESLLEQAQVLEEQAERLELLGKQLEEMVGICDDRNTGG